MEQIYIGKKENGEVVYGYLVIRDDRLPEPEYVPSLSHLTYFVAGVVAGQQNPHVKWFNGTNGSALRPLGESEIEEIVSEPHLGTKVREAFIKDGLMNP